MKDVERISRLIGAAMSECSSSGLEDVRTLLARAARRLGEFRESIKKEQAKSPPPFVGMTRGQRDAVIRAIDDMIEGEASKAPREEERLNLFG